MPQMCCEGVACAAPETAQEVVGTSPAQALPTTETEELGALVPVPAGCPVAQWRNQPHIGLQATADSRSEERAKAIGGA
jgi:hypothetical protein